MTEEGPGGEMKEERVSKRDRRETRAALTHVMKSQSGVTNMRGWERE